MTREEFLAMVRERGQYQDLAEAERVARAVLGLLGARLTAGEVSDLASQLPGQLKDALVEAPQQAQNFGVEEFIQRLSEALGATPETARWDASAVLTTLAESISGGQLNQVLSQLQSGYAELFGKTDLS